MKCSVNGNEDNEQGFGMVDFAPTCEPIIENRRAQTLRAGAAESLSQVDNRRGKPL